MPAMTFMGSNLAGRYCIDCLRYEDDRRNGVCAPCWARIVKTQEIYRALVGGLANFAKVVYK